MDTGHDASEAGLPEAMLPWLHNVQQAARGHQQAAEQSVEQQMDSACAVSAVGRSETGRSGAGAKQALFLEIQSRLPPRLPGQAGYTDVYDFPDSVLAVADSFLRDAPASQEQPDLGAALAVSDVGIPACSAAAAATEAATSSAPHNPAEACLLPPIATVGTGGPWRLERLPCLLPRMLLPSMLQRRTGATEQSQAAASGNDRKF